MAGGGIDQQTAERKAGPGGQNAGLGVYAVAAGRCRLTEREGRGSRRRKGGHVSYPWLSQWRGPTPAGSKDLSERGSLTRRILAWPRIRGQGERWFEKILLRWYVGVKRINVFSTPDA